MVTPGWKGKVPGARVGIGTVLGYMGAAPNVAVLKRSHLGASTQLEAKIDCCCTPFVVMAPTCVSMFCRALKIPQLARKTDFPLPRTSQANPRRGWNIFHWFGSLPVDGKAGLLSSAP